MRSLAERLRAYEQQKARLADAEAKLKDAEKRARTRRLIEIGGLVEKVGLGDFSTEALYGALLSLRESIENTKQLGQWATAGTRALAQEDPALDKDREPIVLTFPTTLTRETISVLRTGGFRFNKVLQHWEGFASFKDAQHLATAHGGNAHKVSSSTVPAAISNTGSE